MTSRCVLSLSLRPEQHHRVRRLARRWGRTPSETGVRLLEESLRLIEFAGIEFRDGPGGRVAHLKGSRLQVWWLVREVGRLDRDVSRAAALWDVTPDQIQAALNYAEAFPDEIEAAIQDDEAVTVVHLKRQLPGLREVTVQGRSQR